MHKYARRSTGRAKLRLPPPLGCRGSGRALAGSLAGGASARPGCVAGVEKDKDSAVIRDSRGGERLQRQSAAATASPVARSPGAGKLNIQIISSELYVVVGA